MLRTDFETANGEHVIAMEYVSGGELFDMVLDNEGLTEAQAKPLFYQIATAVAHCHKVGPVVWEETNQADYEKFLIY